MLKKLPYIALYLSRHQQQAADQQLSDVLYQFPNQMQSKLLQVTTTLKTTNCVDGIFDD